MSTLLVESQATKLTGTKSHSQIYNTQQTHIFLIIWLLFAVTQVDIKAGYQLHIVAYLDP